VSSDISDRDESPWVAHGDTSAFAASPCAPGLRHAFASQLLQAGMVAAYVTSPLGHASIQLTIDTYGKWLPMADKAAVDARDNAFFEESRAGSPRV